MSEQGGTGTGAADTRGGKYCPRCGTMAFRDQASCDYCGHQFRSGTIPSAAPAVAPTRPPDDLHRTQQFSLPPLPRTLPPLPAAPAPPPKALWPLGLAGLAALLLIGFFWKRAAPPAPTPAGAWATTLRGTGAGAQAVPLKFVFAADGSGTYALGTTPPAPLHWAQAGNTLTLTLTPPTPPDAQYATLAAVFNGRPWVWHRDPARRTLTLNTLTFTEAP